MIIGNKIDFYLTEIYNFSGKFKKLMVVEVNIYFSETPSIPGKLCMDDLDSAFIEATNKLRSKLRHAREQGIFSYEIRKERLFSSSKYRAFS